MMINLRGQRRINSRRVAFQGVEILKITNHKGEPAEIEQHYVEDTEGRRHYLDWDGETERDRANVVPATGALNVVELFYDPDRAPLFEARRFPIIAWRLSQTGWPQPVYVGGPIPSDTDGYPDIQWMVLIELPDGAFQAAGYEAMWFPNLEKAQEALRLETNRKAAKPTP